MFNSEKLLVPVVEAFPFLPATIKGLTITLVTLAIGRLLLSLYHSHAYLYQLSDKTVVLENWVQIFVPSAKKLKLKGYRNFLAKTLPKAGARRDLSVDYFIANQMFLTFATFVASVIFFYMIFNLSIVVVFILSLIIGSLPLLKLTDDASNRLRSFRKDISFFLDYIALAISAGMDFNRALDTLVKNAPKTPLRDEFAIVYRDLQLGITREEALLNVDARVQSPEIRIFVQNMVQSLKLGTNIADTLQTISSSMSIKRFQVAEEEAGKISVRMMLPLICFILPCIFIILIGPMILGFIGSGK